MMRKLILLLFVGILLLSCTTVGADEGRILRFIYCSDVHYGLEREFRGKEAGSDEVSRAMLETFKLLPETQLPEDNGVGAGVKFGSPDFVVCTGDIANRMEDGVQSATTSWTQFCNDWDSSISVPLYLVPGNHDISNAIGYPKPLSPEKDAASAAGIFNWMMKPAVSRTAETFNYQTDKVHYSFVQDGVRFAFMGMWPDVKMRQWFDQEIGTDTITPVILFTHDPPIAETKHFTNPNGKHTINSVDKFQNLLTDTCLVTDVKKEAEKNWEKLEQFVYSRPMIKAYFHGDKNYNEFYTWHGVNGTISLPVFRVDSPMKGEYSSDDERKLSFIVVTMDIDKRLLTARECLWNMKDQTFIQWGTTTTITF